MSEYKNIGLHEVLFAKYDDDGNAEEWGSGKVKLYTAPYNNFEHTFEHITEEDLVVDSSTIDASDAMEVLCRLLTHMYDENILTRASAQRASPELKRIYNDACELANEYQGLHE